MKNRLFILIIAVSFTVVTTTKAEGNDIVWVWNQQCPKPTNVMLKVLLDDKIIYSTSLSLCRWGREFENGKVSFRFTPKRTLIWYGYQSDEGDGKKDTGDSSPASATLKVEFWQAGGETDFIELGYTVDDGDRLYINSIHILSPTRRSKTTMAPGLILETWPE